MPTITSLDTIDLAALAGVTGGASPSARALQALDQATTAVKSLAQSVTPNTGPSAISSILPGPAGAGQSLLSSWQSSGVGAAVPTNNAASTPALPNAK